MVSKISVEVSAIDNKLHPGKDAIHFSYSIDNGDATTLEMMFGNVIYNLAKLVGAMDDPPGEYQISFERVIKRLLNSDIPRRDN